MAFPIKLNAATPVGSDSPADAPAEFRNIEQFIVDVFGISDNTNYTAAAMSITSAGVVTLSQSGTSGKTLTLAAGTLTTDTKVLDLSATWNSTSFAFTAIKLNITNSASSASSMLIDLQVGGATNFGVNRSGTVTAGTWQGSTVAAAFGGTGFSSYTTGDLLYASGSTTLAKLADVAAGSYLRSAGAGAAPVWSTLTLPNAASTGALFYASSGTTMSSLAISATSNKPLTTSGTAPQWGDSITVSSSGVAIDQTDSNGSIRVDGYIEFGSLGGTGKLRLDAGDLITWECGGSDGIISSTNGSPTRVQITPFLDVVTATVSGAGSTTAVNTTIGGSGPAAITASGWGILYFNGSKFFVPIWAG